MDFGTILIQILSFQVKELNELAKKVLNESYLFLIFGTLYHFSYFAGNF